jgi:hypothetical protein
MVVAVQQLLNSLLGTVIQVTLFIRLSSFQLCYTQHQQALVWTSSLNWEWFFINIPPSFHLLEEWYILECRSLEEEPTLLVHTSAIKISKFQFAYGALAIHHSRTWKFPRIYVFSSCCRQFFLTDSAMLLLARGKEKYLWWKREVTLVIGVHIVLNWPVCK